MEHLYRLCPAPQRKLGACGRRTASPAQGPASETRRPAPRRAVRSRLRAAEAVTVGRRIVDDVQMAGWVPATPPKEVAGPGGGGGGGGAGGGGGGYGGGPAPEMNASATVYMGNWGKDVPQSFLGISHEWQMVEELASPETLQLLQDLSVYGTGAPPHPLLPPPLPCAAPRRSPRPRGRRAGVGGPRAIGRPRAARRRRAARQAGPARSSLEDGAALGAPFKTPCRASSLQAPSSFASAAAAPTSGGTSPRPACGRR
jgi:hypothetical protein